MRTLRDGLGREVVATPVQSINCIGRGQYQRANRRYAAQL